MEETNGTEEVSFFEAVKKGFSEIGETFGNFLKAPRALWGINISYFLEGWAYFGVLTILGIYLSSDVGLWDLHAGWVLLFLTSGITLAMLFLGGVADKISVRKALLVSLFFLVIGRLLLAFSGTFFEYRLGLGSPMFFCVLAGILMVIIGYGIYQPASYAGVRHFTTKKTSSMGFAMIYALMNLGAFVSGVVSPTIRGRWGMVGVFWLYVIITLLAFLSVFFILTKKTEERAIRLAREDRGEEEEEKKEEGEEKRKKWDKYSILLGAGIVAALAGIFVVAILTPPTKEEKLVNTYKNILRDLGKEFKQVVEEGEKLGTRITPEKAKELAGRLNQKLNVFLGKLLESAKQTVPPVNPNLLIDHSAYKIMREFFGTEESWLSSIPTGSDLWSPTFIPKEMYQEVKKKGRAFSISLMAMAYGLVSKVDRDVVDHLRLRFKKSEEEMIPMTEEEIRETCTTANLPPSGILSGLKARFDDFEKDVRGKIPGELGGLFSRRLSSFGHFSDSVGSYLKENRLGEVGKEILLKILIYDSLEIKDFVEAMEGSAGKGIGEMPKGKKLFDYISLVVENRKALTKELLKDFPSASARKGKARLMEFFLKYGIFGCIILILSILLVKRIFVVNPEHPFHNLRFTFFIFILIPVQTLFAHNWLTFPYYLSRAFGGTWISEHFEFFSNINPILIFFLTPTIAALTRRANVYKMMILGTAVMSLPTFFLVLPPTTVTLLTYILFMSIGEAMWQPRFLQFVAEIAPKGKTGIYMGIAQFPWFLTKVVTGAYSGALLEAYCPMVGPQSPQTLWLINGCIAVTSTIGLILAKNWILSGKMSVK